MPPPLDRRTLLTATAALGVGSIAAHAPGADPLSGAALYRDVETYSGFGEHRTGGAPDHTTSRWLAAELKRAGCETELVPWRTQQFFLDRCELTVGNKQLEAFPVWWPKATRQVGTRADLAPLEATTTTKGAIAFAAVDGLTGGGAVLNPGGPVAAMAKHAVARGATGLIVIERNPIGELVALNAQDTLAPFPIPVVLVGGKDEAHIEASLMHGPPVQLAILGRIEPAAIGYEVLGHIGSGPREVIVSTPSSGWFHCAGERGPGIAIWLALARMVGKATPPGVRFTFIASSGHELDGVGMHHFLKEIAPQPERVKSWLHLGAGIATYAYDGARRLDRVSAARGLMTNDPALMPALERDFEGQPGLKPVLTDKPVGEMSYMAEHGYKCWGIAGGSALHHMRSDLPARATGQEILEPTARAIHRALMAAAS